MVLISIVATPSESRTIARARGSQPASGGSTTALSCVQQQLPCTSEISAIAGEWSMMRPGRGCRWLIGQQHRWRIDQARAMQTRCARLRTTHAGTHRPCGQVRRFEAHGHFRCLSDRELPTTSRAKPTFSETVMPGRRRKSWNTSLSYDVAGAQGAPGVWHVLTCRTTLPCEGVISR